MISKQVCLAQKLSRYSFLINFDTSKVNKAVHTLLQQSKRKSDEEVNLEANSIKTLYHLQSFLGKVSGLAIENLFLTP